MEKESVNTSQCNSENDVFNAKLNNLIEQIRLVRNAKLISEDDESIRRLSDELKQKKTEVDNLNKINERQKIFLLRGGIWVFIATYAIYAICALVLLIAAVCCCCSKPLLLIGGILVLLILAVIVIVVAAQAKHVLIYEKECS